MNPLKKIRRLFRRDPVVPVIRLTGVIGAGTPLRQGLSIASLAGTLDRAFSMGGRAVANPPFLEAGEARLPQGAMLSRAHASAPGELESWIRCLAAFVKPRGTVTIVHRADALPRLLGFLHGRFGGLTVYPLYPREGVPATRILIQGRKGSRAPLRLMRGMVLHGAGNGFTAEAEPILRGGSGLELAPAD